MPAHMMSNSVFKAKDLLFMFFCSSTHLYHQSVGSSPRAASVGRTRQQI